MDSGPGKVRQGKEFLLGSPKGPGSALAEQARRKIKKRTKERKTNSAEIEGRGKEAGKQPKGGRRAPDAIRGAATEHPAKQRAVWGVPRLLGVAGASGSRRVRGGTRLLAAASHTECARLGLQVL